MRRGELGGWTRIVISEVNRGTAQVVYTLEVEDFENCAAVRRHNDAEETMVKSSERREVSF